MNSLHEKTNENKVQPGAVVDWKSIGNQHFNSKRYKNAVAAYTKGIEQGDNLITLQANRSAAYLALSKYKLALDDAELVLATDKHHFKCIFRKVTALFGMRLYKDAIAFLETIDLQSKPQSDKQMFIDLLSKGKSFIAQSKHGDYPWYEIHKTQIKYHDMADYTSSVIVKESPSKGRGLFATKHIKAGELVLASKAFVYLEDNVPNPHPNLAKLLEAQINVHLFNKIVKILEETPEKCIELYRLYAGPDLGYVKFEDEVTSKEFCINKNRIESISMYNRFSACDVVDDGTMNRTSGIWIISSFLNHSCVDANSSWCNIGDFMFVRAARNISEGEEITISYQAPNGLIAQQDLDMYDFTCSCRLCERDRMDNETVKATRATTFSQLQNILEKFKVPSDLRMQKKDEIEILRLLKLFEQTRKDTPELNCCLFNELLVFGIFRFELLDFVKAANTHENLFELVKNVPAYSFTAIDACIHIIIAYSTARKMSKAKYWFEILKKQMRITYGTEKVLKLIYPMDVQIMRDNGLNV